MSERICLACKHCIVGREPKYSLCAKLPNDEFALAARVVGEAQAARDGARKYGFCESARRDYTDNCGVTGRWFEPKEAK